MEERVGGRGRVRKMEEEDGRESGRERKSEEDGRESGREMKIERKKWWIEGGARHRKVSLDRN